jgi:hypothetical protein
MWFKALEVASRLTLPIPVVAFALVFAAFIFWLALRSRRTTSLFWIFLVASLSIVTLGLAPLAASTYLAAHGIYRVSIEVIGPENQSVRDVEIASLPQTAIKSAGVNWELDIAPQTAPADRTLIITAKAPSAFLSGSTKVVLGSDYFPIARVRLEPLPSVTVRGVVRDERGKPIEGAVVAIDGFPEHALTNYMGSFQIESHYPKGQMLSVTAKKHEVSTKLSGPAGDGFELVLPSK